jgi:hypothetical protein
VVAYIWSLQGTNPENPKAPEGDKASTGDETETEEKAADSSEATAVEQGNESE